MSVGPDEVGDRVALLEAELASLRRALHNRATIEQAMGILAVLRRCTPEDAFRLLVRLSQVHNVKLHRIAQLLVQLTSGAADTATLEVGLADALRAAPAQESRDGDAPPRVDETLVEAARHVVSAPRSGAEANRAVRDLYRLLIDRGWIPPYDVLVWV